MILPLFQFVKFDDEHGKEQWRLRKRFGALEQAVMTDVALALVLLRDEIDHQRQVMKPGLFLDRTVFELEIALSNLQFADRTQSLLALQAAYWWAGKRIWESQAEINLAKGREPVVEPVEGDTPK